ncbi:hypothetical protein XELAEV_18032241mg [Xenopus laevis]|uniref:Uncharacterized protein n=1 Tax=Xenopus laevis TaxID=8355 RepID=A0A974CPS8_XENLA|nr:hypothetical protein XELAEV_18032241mg [Xenopus laevis]
MTSERPEIAAPSPVQSHITGPSPEQSPIASDTCPELSHSPHCSHLGPKVVIHCSSVTHHLHHPKTFIHFCPAPEQSHIIDPTPEQSYISGPAHEQQFAGPPLNSQKLLVQPQIIYTLLVVAQSHHTSWSCPRAAAHYSSSSSKTPKIKLQNSTPVYQLLVQLQGTAEL